MSAIYSENKQWKIKHHTERYAQSASARQPLLLLSGWSCDSRIFEWLIPGLAQHFVVVTAELLSISDDLTFDQCCEELAETLFPEFTQPINILAWSLGGNVAIELAASYPQRCAHLTVMAATPVFVARDDFSQAMSPAVFSEFQKQVSDNKEVGLKQFDRLLSSGSDRESLKALRASLVDYRKTGEKFEGSWDQASLNNGLKFLAELDQRETLMQLQQASGESITVQALLFENDALVNSAVAEYYLQSSVIEGASHVGFLTHTDVVYDACLAMLSNTSDDFGDEKLSVANSFSNAAKTYDDASEIQQRIASNLLSLLSHAVEVSQHEPHYIVDAGCGTGVWTNLLSQAAEHVTGVDLADGMLTYAKSQFPHIKHWVQADLENMPLIHGQTDYIFSSLAVQWCDDFAAMLLHWYQLLQPGGQVVLATLATDTLCELAHCFSQLDSHTHVNDFLSYEQIITAINSTEFSLEYASQDQEIQYYPSAVALMHDLKAIGAQTVKTQAGLIKPTAMTKSQLAQLAISYEQFRGEDGLLPSTYDVVYLYLKKPSE